MEATTAERHASGGPAGEPPAQNLAKAFQMTVERLGDDSALRWGEDGRMSWNELRARAAAVAGGLASLGVGKEDTVAIMLNNRAEFFPIDLGVSTLGGVPFSIYQTASPEQIAYVVGDAAAKVAFVEKAFLEVFEKAKADLPDLEHVIVLDGEGGTTSFEEFLEIDPDFDDVAAADGVELDDPLTLIYTSGTTGPPKGVELTHRNLLTLVAGVDDLIAFPTEGAKVISWLPAAHIAERGAHYYLPMTKGVEVSICPDPRTIIDFLPKVRPSWFFAVPRVWEKLKAGLETMLAGLPEEQREPAQQGLQAAIAKVRAEQAGEEVPEAVAKGAAAAEEQMFAGLRKHLGLDEAVAVNVGAAPTPVEVLEFFHAIGIPVGELWGMSETCGAATVNPPERVKLGTVGPPLPGVEIRLAEDGEVEVKGDLIMRGYRNLPDKTAEVFDDERWMSTGDIGVLDEDGYLEDRRPQEGADHQRRRQEHVAGGDRGQPEVGQPADRPVRRDRRRPLLQRRADRPRPRLRAVLGEAAGDRDDGHRRARRERAGPRGGLRGGRRRQREDVPGRADQEVQAPPRGVGAGRGRAHPDDEAEAQADRREVRRRDRGALRQVGARG